MKATTYVEKYGISGEIIEGVHTSSKDGWEHYEMVVRLAYKTKRGEVRTTDVEFFCGVGWNMPEFTGDTDLLPTESVATVLETIAPGFHMRDMAWDDWASEFHLGDAEDLPVREYHRWEASRDQGRKIHDWLYSQEMVDDLENISEDDAER